MDGQVRGTEGGRCHLEATLAQSAAQSRFSPLSQTRRYALARDLPNRMNREEQER